MPYTKEEEAIRSFAEAHMKLAVFNKKGDPDTVSIGLPLFTGSEETSSEDLSRKCLLGHQGASEDRATRKQSVEDDATLASELFAKWSHLSATPASTVHVYPEQSMAENAVYKSSGSFESSEPCSPPPCAPGGRCQKRTVQHASWLDRTREKAVTMKPSEEETTSASDRLPLHSHVKNRIKETSRRWLRWNR